MLSHIQYREPMIKRLYNITRASINSFFVKRTEERDFDSFINAADPIHAQWQESAVPDAAAPDSLTPYYANLELAPGADRQAVRSAWKRLMKKYHPDLHAASPEKRETANELTRELTQAYRILDQELSKKEK